MISLAGRDILHSSGKFVLTGLGLGLLIGVTFTMAGVYRGMVDDANVLLHNSGADVWVVQKETQGPYAESSSLRDDVYREILGMPGLNPAADAPYLTSLQRRGPGRQRFCGYGAATPDLSAPGVEWRGQDTYIQKDGIVDDFGVFDSPDEFYASHGSNLSGLKRWLYTHVIRHRMNAQVRRIRAEKW